ncbi:hypothetical protein QTP88_011867 [Uroleucon formosanum]
MSALFPETARCNRTVDADIRAAIGPLRLTNQIYPQEWRTYLSPGNRVSKPCQSIYKGRQRPRTLTFVPTLKVERVLPESLSTHRPFQEQLLESSCVESETFDDNCICSDGTVDFVGGGLREPTAVVDAMSAATDRPQRVRHCYRQLGGNS